MTTNQKTELLSLVSAWRSIALLSDTATANVLRDAALELESALARAEQGEAVACQDCGSRGYNYATDEREAPVRCETCAGTGWKVVPPPSPASGVGEE